MASIFGYSSVEEPKFEVFKQADGYEVREYGPQLRAVVQMPDMNTGPAFRQLAGYIFGGNTAKGKEAAEKIAMTAPVAMSLPIQENEKIAMTAPVSMSGYTMSFTMPSKYTKVDDLPIPKNSNVKLIEVPPVQYAVIRYSGSLSESWNKEHEKKLRDLAARDGLELSNNPGDVQVWGYNPPWTLPWFKRNEVAIPLTKPL